ncbi:MAG: RraA family protein [Chitinophagaceae bacterium]
MTSRFYLSLVITASMAYLPSATGQLVMDSLRTTQYTQDWTGPRDANGRPWVGQIWIDRAAACSFEDLWTALHNYGYANQFEGGFQVLHADTVMVGRALTAEFVPDRLDLDTLVSQEGRMKKWTGSSNAWPILQLQEGDIYIADGAGKVDEGTLIGDNLGSAIYARSHNGVIFHGGARDRDGLKQISGFNAWVRGWNPSFLKDMTLLHINFPTRIGSLTIMPGDIVVANDEGILSLPYSIADKVVILAELIGYRGLFGKEMLVKGIYQPGQIDNQWTETITAHFIRWLKENHPDCTITREQIMDAFKKRSW